MIAPFSLARLPRIEFGAGSLARVPALAAAYGSRTLIVCGARALQSTPHWQHLLDGLRKHGLDWDVLHVGGEPSPQLVDAAVAQFRAGGFDVVVGIGGGSVLDAAKAIAGLLRVGDSVMDYLEGVGPEKPYRGPATPFIAIPTTAGTGSEATKNAVLSQHGADGFKKSFRDEKLVPEYAIVDPNLLASCPPELIAANGMDALTQLIESYVSLRANTFTDALVISGLRAARDGLLPWYEGSGDQACARSRMAYAALISGIALAQTGLGSVHGLAAPMGAFFPIPHGVVCGTLVASATRVNIAVLHAREPDNPALAKYARLAEILCERRIREPVAAYTALIERLEDWTERLRLPRLAHYRIAAADIPRIVAHSRGSSMKTNPVVLTDEEIAQVLEARL
ncbi:MAG: iron-containing alcohol dehydrogenase [Gammaproteobacteria bacterium]|nr:iron-containing alcohol dehydrogenase [Gammaproteobacteria bacterium]